MRSASILAIAGFLAVAVAQPLEKRAEDVDWVTVTSTQEVVKTIDVTMTKYINGPVATPEPEPHHHKQPSPPEPQHHHVHHHQQHHHTHKPAPKPVTTQAPAPSPPPQTTEAAPPPAVTPEAHSPKPKPSPKPSPQPSNPEPAGGYTNHGDMTYYTPGLGACGITSGPSDNIVAIGEGLFDQYTPSSGNPNDNALCGQMINILKDGKKATAKVVDRCTGCDDQSIDMSPGLFSSLASMSLGRTSVAWGWVNPSVLNK